jgi:hypothetical protein
VKKLIICLFVSTLFTPLSLFAQPSNYLKAGVNYSSLRTEGGKSEPGLTFGFGKDFFPIRSFSGFFGFEVNYTRKKVTLENKTWPTNFDPAISDIAIGDIAVDIGFLEVPVNVGYFLQIKKYVVMRPSVGTSLSVPIQMKTYIKNSRTIFLDPDDKGKYEFDYLHWDEVHANVSTNLQIGLDFYYHCFGLLIQYQRAFVKTNSSRSLTIRDKLDSFQISLAYAFCKH